jgi:hypothetical protein
MSDKPTSELMQYQIGQLQKAIDLIADDFDIVHELQRKVDLQENQIALLQKVVFGLIGLVLVAVVGAILKGLIL